jgi:TilS substrate binding domain.
MKFYEVLQQDLAACGSSQTLSLVVLQQLSLARQRQLLSHWMKGEGQYRPSFEMVQRLFSEVIGSREDSQAALHWNGFYYLRFQQQLHRIAKADYLPAESIQEVEVITCVAGQCLKLPAGHFVIQPSEVGLSPELLGQQLQITPTPWRRKNSFIWSCRKLAVEKSHSAGANFSMAASYYSNIKPR